MDDAAQLAQELLDARARTLALVDDLTDRELEPPRLAIVNPLRWELGHVAWFQEHWILRRSWNETSSIAAADSLYDSSKVAHATRWDLPLPSRADTLAYLRGVLERVLDRLESHTLTPTLRYFHRLVVFHEDMHGEALAYTRQTLGLREPAYAAPVASGGGPLHGDVELLGGRATLGASPSASFVFDNEKWEHEVDVRPFRIARAPVTQREFAEFVDDRGYLRRDLWGADGWSWRERVDARHPVYWRSDGGRWLARRFDRFVELEPDRPVVHVNWHEADAFCRWRGRRLPTEAEWELAASRSPTGKRAMPWGDAPWTPELAHLDGSSLACRDVGALERGDSADGARQMLGNVWEWTASDFEPYLGFVADPYEDYSQPWFRTHKVLRGGCFATRARLIRNTWRNFFLPERNDVFAGFRTVAL